MSCRRLAGFRLHRWKYCRSWREAPKAHYGRYRCSARIHRRYTANGHRRLRRALEKARSQWSHNVTPRPYLTIVEVF